MFKISRITLLSIGFATLLGWGCHTSRIPDNSTHILNELSKKEQTQGWKLLFDGKSTAGWHNYLKSNISGWKVADGVLFTDGKNGDIVTDEEFSNFELIADW